MTEQYKPKFNKEKFKDLFDWLENDCHFLAGLDSISSRLAACAFFVYYFNTEPGLNGRTMREVFLEYLDENGFTTEERIGTFHKKFRHFLENGIKKPKK